MVGRKIIHIDLDAFYASVEQLDHPRLRGHPVVVGGSPQSRGVVATASYEARKFGIRSAMSCAQAYRLCPHAHFMPARFDRYKELSLQIRMIFYQVTDLVEPLSLDEAYLDVTENYLNEPSAQRVAEYLRRRILEETGLTASAGVAPLKFVAKIASDIKKPNGLTVIGPQHIDRFIQQLPVAKLWSVGPATEKKLKSLGIHHAGDFRRFDVADLVRHLGKHGCFLYDLAHGIDHRRVQPHRQAKSRGVERTFHTDIIEVNELIATLEKQATRVEAMLRKIDKPGRTVTLKLRYSDFHTVTRSRSLVQATQDKNKIFAVAKERLLEHTEAGIRPVRLIGISVSGFGDEPCETDQLRFSF